MLDAYPNGAKVENTSLTIILKFYKEQKLLSIVFAKFVVSLLAHTTMRGFKN